MLLRTKKLFLATFLCAASAASAFAVSAPPSVGNLSASAVSSTGLGASSMTVTLTWTAPGDGDGGNIAGGFFSIRYATTPITNDAEFDSAPYSLDIATSAAAGTLQTATINFLDAAATHYFVLKSTDAEPLTSSLSNAATAQAYRLDLADSFSGSQGAAWGDYDGDGDLDLAVARNGDEYLLRNDGGAFSRVDLPGSGGNSVTAAWGDYDGDGDLDLAVANSAGGDEILLRNDGGGTFAVIALSGTGGNSTGIAWGDFNGDGRLDLAVANDGAEDYFATNDGDGTFSTFTITGTGGASQGIAWGDYDGDGDLDAAVASYGSPDFIIRNDGFGAFSTFTVTATADNSLSVSWADYDLDGDLDLAVAVDLGADNFILRNDGGGTFVKVALTGSGGNSRGIAWADYDADGDSDLVVSNVATEPVYLLINNGGVFEKRALPKTAGASRGVSWGDFNGDGDLDLAVADSAELAYVLRNDTQTVNSPPAAPSSGFAARFAEFWAGSSSGILTLEWAPGSDAETSDADGLQYFVRLGTTASGSSTFYSIPALFGWDGYSGAGSEFYSTRGSTVAGRRGLRAALSKETTAYWAVATVDGGLRRSAESSEQSVSLAAPAAVNDLAVSAVVSTGLGASSMTATLSWTAPSSFAGEYDLRYSTVSPVTTFAAYDQVPAANRIAVATTAVGGQPVSYSVPGLDAGTTHYFAITQKTAIGVRSALSNPATAQSSAYSIAGSGGQSGDIAWGDFDGDGDVDLAVVNTGNEANYLVRNDGGALGTKITLANGDLNSQSLNWADYDNDGDLDFGVANDSNQADYFMRNDGGNLDNKVLSGGSGFSSGFAWGDYDNDGDLDAAVALNTASPLAYLLRNNGGSFSVVNLPGSAVTLGAAWGDYDQDGDLDLALTSDGDAFLFRNDGGAFTTTVPLTGSGASAGVAWGDFDLDGDLDLALGKGGAATVVWWNAGGVLGSPTTLPDAGSGGFLTVGDYDNDGDLDIAVTGNGTGDEVLLANNGDGTFSAPVVLRGTGGNSRSLSFGDYDDDGDLDLAIANTSGEDVFVVRNDTPTANAAPSAPASGFSAVFQEYSVSATSGVVSFLWDPAADNGFSTTTLKYFVRVGTNNVAGSSSTMKIPDRFSPSGGYSGSAHLYSTHLSSAQRGLKLVLQKETTAHWAVAAEDAGFRRSGESSEQIAYLLAPAAVTDLSAAVVSTGLGASSMTVTLSWTAPSSFSGEYDIRYSTVSAVSDLDAYAAVPSQNRITIATSAVGGEAQSYAILYLAARTTHYFSITQKTAIGVRSGLSNGAVAQSYFLRIPASSSNTLAVAWGDMDEDGDLDLAAANGTGQKETVYRRNPDGTYSSLDAGALTTDSADVAWGDLDNDGDLDFITANSGVQDEIVFINNGNGTFTPQTVAASAGDSFGIAIGDLDNDGYLDFAVANNSAEDNYIALNDGSGGFSTFTLTGSGGASNKVALGDYDNDGDLDIAFANDSGQDVVLAENLGEGVFSTSAVAGSGGDSVSLAWGDYDGDGNLDLAVGNLSAEIYLLKGDGSGGFSKVVISGSAGDAWGLAWGDLDNDGDLDLAAAQDGRGELFLYNDGAGNFSAARTADTGNVEFSVSLGDADGDGDLDVGVGVADNDNFVIRNDIVAAHTPPAPPAAFSAAYSEFGVEASSGTLTLAWQNGSDAETTNANLLSYFVRVGTTVAGSSTTLKFPDDFSASASADGGGLYSTRASTAALWRGIRLTMQKEATAYWSVMTLDSEFSRSAASSEQTTPLVAPAAAADLGVAAIVSTGPAASTMTVVLTWTSPGDDGAAGNISGGEFDIRYSTLAPILSMAEYAAVAPAFRVVVSSFMDAGSLQTYSIADLNAYATHYFAITIKDGLGVRSGLSNPATAQAFLKPVAGSNGFQRGAAWGDMDGDGDLDFVVAGEGTNPEWVFTNNGDGTFSQSSLGTAGNSPALALGDYDNDGDLDIAVANRAGEDEVILRNDGGGAYTDVSALTGSLGDSFALAWGDYDNDGDLDLAVANIASQDEYVATNNGDGTFSTFTITGSGGNSTGIAWGDYDNDGDLDLAVANDNGADSVILRNDGGGNFSVTSLLSGSGGTSKSVAWFDFDGDGWLDLAVAQNSSVDILRNNSGTSFSAQATVATEGSAAQGVVVGDFDGDGDPDLATQGGNPHLITNKGDGTFSVAKILLPGVEGVSWGDMDGDGDLDLVAAINGGPAWTLRNDTPAARSAPAAPAAGFSAAFVENGLFFSTGVLTFKWGAGSDAQTPAAGLEYRVRIGTGASNSSTTMKIPLPYGLDGASGGGSFLHSTRLPGGERGIKLAAQKEATYYWTVSAEDSEFLRSAQSAIQAADLSAPAKVTNLSAAIDASVQTSSSAWVALSFTAPGENGTLGNLQAGALFDIRWSTSGVVDTQAKYAAAPYQALLSAVGTTAGVLASRSVPVEDPNKTHYFALTTLDQFGARSALSNAPAGVAPRILREEITNIASTSVLQDRTTGFLRLKVWTDGGNIKWNGLKVKRLGTLPDAAIKVVGIWDDSANGNQTFDSADTGNRKTSDAVFVSSRTSLNFTTPPTISGSTQTFFLGVEFDPNFLPVEGATVALALDGEAFIIQQGAVGAADFPALGLDGTDDGARAGADNSLNVGNFTVEAWVKTTDAGADRVVVSRGDGTTGMRLWLNGSGCGAGVPTFYVGSAFLCANKSGTTVPIHDGEWHHVAAAFDSTNGKRMFIDGVGLSTGPFSGTPGNVTEGIGVGIPSQPTGLGGNLAGAVDEVRISNFSTRYSTTTEFIPQKRFPDNEGNTVLLYHFDGSLDGTFDSAAEVEDDSDLSNTNKGSLLGSGAGYGRSTFTAVIDIQDVLVASGTDIAPGTMFRNQKDIGMLRLDLWTEGDNATLEQFFVTPVGEGSGAENLTFYRDDGDGEFRAEDDTSLLGGVSFFVGTATFDLAGGGVEQLIDATTKTYFVAWDMGASAPLNLGLGLKIAATTNFTLAGSTDVVFNAGFPMQTSQSQIVGAEVFVTPEVATGVWVNVSSIVFRTNFGEGNVDHYHYRWDRSPATNVGGTDATWAVGKNTVTATVDANDWYFHVRAFAVDPTSGTQVNFGPFWVDRAPPSGSAFRTYSSTGGMLAESQFSDLAAAVTAQFAVQDSTSGLNLDGPAPAAPSSGTVSLWNFDEQAGAEWADASGPGRNTLNIGAGSMTRMQGRFKTGLLFDGASHLIDPTPIGLPVGNAPRAFEAWLFPLSTSSTRGLASWGNTVGRMRLALQSGQLAADMGAGYVARGPVVSTGVWQHVAFTFDGSVGRYYIDGAEVGNNAFGAQATVAGGIFVGDTDAAGTKYLGGMDDVRILGRAPSSGEIQETYSRGDPYYVSYSTDAGNSWRFIASTSAASASRVELAAAHGSLAQETIKVYGMDLVVSTYAQTGSAATNQVRFHVSDVAGNVLTAGPFAVLVDTNAPIAVSTPALPVNGAYVKSNGTRPNFHWVGPAPSLVGGMKGNFFLEVDENDAGFATPVISISTPALAPDGSVSGVNAAYVSTFTLNAGSTYYWRVKARSNLGVDSPWSQTASFVTDVTTPSVSAFRVKNSSGGLFLETENIDLLAGVTAQITLEDAPSGPAGLSYYSEYPSTAGVIGYWNFNETGGANPADATGNGNNGTLSCGTIACSSATYAVTPFGSGMKCSGGQGMTASNTNLKFPAGSDFTIEAWIYPQTVSSIRVIAGMGTPLSAGRNYTMSIVSGDLQFNSDGGSFTGTDDAIKLNEWQHVAMTVENTKVTFYVNGAFDSSGNAASGNGDSQDMLFSVCSGINPSGVWSGFFGGMIDEVRVIGRALDAKQIAADYAATAAGRFAVEYSTTAGQNWNVVSATSPSGSFPYLSVTGNTGSVGQETLEVRNLALTHSTSSLTGSQGTNQLRFTVPDRAGNLLASGAFTILVDTVAAASVATPVYPISGSYAGARPTFNWAGPSSKTVLQMGAGAAYWLEADTDGTFANPVIRVSTPVVTASTLTAIVHGTYVSTYTLTDDTTYYWRVRTRNALGLFSQALTVYTFVTDFDPPIATGFVTYNSSGGAVSETIVNDLASGVTAEIRIQDAFPNSGLSTSPVSGIETFGVVYSTLGGTAPQFWVDGGWGSSFSDPAESAVESMAVFQGELYAGTRGGSSGLVYKFTGVGWNPVGGPLPGSSVKSLQVFNNKLYAGLDGDGRVYSWDGVGPWTQAFDTGESQTNAFAVHNGRLYAATGSSGKIWAFDATSGNWFLAFNAPIDPINALEVYKGSLYAAGQGGIYVSSGTTFVVSNGLNANFFALKAFNNKLYAGSNLGGNVYAYDGTSWAVDFNPSESETVALGLHDGRLYVGANAPSPGRIYANDGKDWLLVRQLPSAGDKTLSFAHYAGRLYTGTQLASAGMVFVSTPLAVTLTGVEGSNGQETLRAEAMDFAQSSVQTVCGGASGCLATNQVRFTAADRAGNVRAAGPYAVLVDTLLSQPTAFYPAPSTFVRSANPTFVWKESTLQPTHDIQVSQNADMSSPLFTQNTANGVLQSPLSLSGNTTYYWRVRSINALGIPTAYTAANNFIVDLQAPSVISYRHVNSTGGAVGETQINNLSSGVTVQLNLQDPVAGLLKSTETAPGDHQIPGGGFGVMYSTDAGYTWRVHQSSSLNRDGAQESILSLAVFNGRLYAGQGSGSDDGDVFVYDGATWSAAPAVPNAASVEAIRALAVYQGKLYAGQGSDAGDGDVLEFNGAWSQSYDGAASDMHALAVYNGYLYAGAGGPAAGDGDIHVFDGSSWSLSTGTVETAIRSLAVYEGRLYAGGGTSGLRGFDGKNWTVDPSASADEILSLTVYDGYLFAGTSGGDVRRFDGSTWSTSFAGSQEEIASLAVFDGKLYAGQGAGAGDGDIYVFDGQAWRLAFDGAAERVNALAGFDGRLYAGIGTAAGNGDIVRFTPLTGQSLTGSDGSPNIETLSAHLSLVSSTHSVVCGGSDPCSATNQVLFTVLDRAGNLATEGPYAVLVDTFAPAPNIGSLTPLTTRAIYVTAVATDNLAGLQDYLFEASTDSAFAGTITASPFVAVDSYTFTNLLVATTYYFRVTARDNLLNVSTPSAVQSTSTFGTVFYSSASAVPASALQNAVVPMLRMHLYTPAGTSKFLTLTARLTGSATDQDVAQVQVYRDANGNGTFDAGGETFLAGAAFSNGTAFVPLGGNAQPLSVQISTFFVAYQMSPSATVADTVGLDLVAASDLGLQHPDSAEGPFPTSVPPITITDGANEVTFDPEGASIGAQNAAPGTFNILVKRLDATTPIGTSLIDEMVVHMTGDLDPSKVTRINVWRDRDTPGVFDPNNPQNEDKLTDQGQVFAAIGPGLAVSTVTLSAPASSRTVVQGGGEFFFLTVDLSATADQGKGFQLHIATTADIHLGNPADTVAFATATIRTSTVTAQINNIVTISTRALTQAAYLQGQTYAVLAATMTTDVGTAQISRIKVNLNGSAGDSDISAVAIFKDKDGDGPPFLGSGVDIRLGSTTFTSGQAAIDIAPALQVTQSTTVIYVVYSIASNATGGNTAGAVITDASDITPVDPTTSIQGGPFPIQTALTPIQETINTLLIPAAPAVNPPNLKQGTTNAAMLSFQLQSSNNNIAWSSLTLERLGDTADADVDAVRVYRTSVTAANQISGKVSTDTFTGGSVTVALDQAEIITSTASSYIVALDISPDAVPGSSIAVRVATTAAVSIDAPNVVSSQTTPFPITTPIYVPIQQFDNTVVISSLSIVSPLGALPGAQNVGIMRLKLNTNVSTAKLQSLKVERVGSSVNSDISSVKVYFDKTGSGVWNASNLGAYDLITSTTQSFGSSGPNDVVLNFSTPPVLYPASNPNGQKGFFLVVDVSTTATPDNTVIIRANNETFFQVDNPNRMDAGAKFTAETLTIAAPPSLMYAAGTDVSPGTVTQGATGVAMMRLRLWMENYSGRWSKLNVTRLGSGSDADVSGIRLFDDSGSTPGSFDGGDLELTAGAGVFSGGVASLSFSTQTITTSTKTYYVVCDVDVAAQGGSVGVQINNSGDLPLAAPHVTSNLGFPLATTPSVIEKTQTGMQVLGFPRAPGQLFQEDTDVPIISLQLNTTQFAVLMTGLAVRSTGTAQDADITAVNLWYDVNNNNTFESGTDQRLTAGTERFVGGLASLTILPGSEQTIDTTQKNYFVTVDVAQFADDTKTFGVVVESSSAFTISSPNFVVNANFPAPSSPPISAIKKINETLNLIPTDVSPSGGINQSTEAVMMRLDVSASREDVEWTELRIDKLGTLAISSITAVRLYRSSGTAFISSPSLLVASATFIATQAEMIFKSSETIGTSTKTYFVSVQIDAGARVDDTVGLKLSGAGSLAVTKGDSVSNTNLPLNTALVKILDVRTPTKPVVTLADGAFSNNFEYLEFDWTTTIGVGGLIGASYAVGTTPGGNDVFPGGADPAVFAAIGAAETKVKAKGFALASGTTYYVSVKAQSQVSPDPTVYTSPAGTSDPILVDFTVPPAPAPNVSLSGKTLLFTWGTVTGGPSGIKGYLVEYRTGAVPIWKNAKTNATSSVQTSGFGPSAAVPSSDVVTGNAFQLASLPAGTVFVRMRAVTGAGQAGPPSDEVKLLLGAGLAEGITDVSNYPNPFDSRKEKTTLHFTLGQAGEVSVTIYSIYGRTVKSLGVAGQRGSNEVAWDGTDESGRKVSKGIYLCVIQAGGEKTTRKIGVIH